jgi:hypothetical protein
MTVTGPAVKLQVIDDDEVSEPCSPPPCAFVAGAVPPPAALLIKNAPAPQGPGRSVAGCGVS